MKRRVVVFVTVTFVLVGIEVGAAHFLAARDPVAAVLGRQVGSIIAALALMSARLCLYLILPGWALHLVALGVWTRIREKSS